MPALYINSDTVHQGIITAAIELQARFIREQGTFYLLEDLQKALMGWLELSVEALVDDALFHTVEGDRSYAFNRPAFEFQIKQLQPIDTQIDSHNSVQENAVISARPHPDDSDFTPADEQPANSNGIAVA